MTTRTKEILTSPLVFLVVSFIIIFTSLKVYNYSEAKKETATILAIQPEKEIVINSDIEYTELEKDARDIIDDAVFRTIHKRSEGYCQRVVRYNDAIQYEVIYRGIDDIYTYRNTAVEYWVSTLSLELKDVWAEYGYTDKVIRILMLSEKEEDRILLSAVDGVIDFTIYDKIKIETTREDWAEFFEYTYDRKPTAEELDLFIEEQEENGLL